MGVECADGSCRWFGAAGEAGPDGTPLGPDTPYFIASIDKLFNATVIMKMAEGGQVNLEAPLATYLPGALTRGLNRSGGADYSDRITVRHLLGHTSGLADWLEDRPKGGRSLVERVLEDGDMAVGLEDVAAAVRELRPHFPPQDPAAERSRVRYSDTNYILVTAIIEAATGRPLHQVHEQMLFAPLNMRRTYFPGYSQPLDATPEPTILRFQGRPLHIPLLMRSFRGIYSTVGDTLSFMRSFVRGEIVSRTALASMQRHWHRFGLPFDRAALRSPGWPIEYGLGLMRFRLPRIFAPFNPMPAVIGHTGSTGCWLFHCPQLDLLLTGNVNEVTAGAVPYRVVPRILHILRSRKA
jgi:D-alanyl-D-alanine carboxypeptidase